jgi:cation:H+ antiporter
MAILILELAGAFFLLGFFADLLVRSLRRVGDRLGIAPSVLGFALGVVTTTPEFLLGLAATMMNAASVSVGNLLGGVLVLFGLIPGASVLLRRRIHTPEDFRRPLLLAVGVSVLLPLVLLLDGSLGVWDGFLLVLLYALLLAGTVAPRILSTLRAPQASQWKLTPPLFAAAVGFAGVLLFSNVIMVVAHPLLLRLPLVGLGALLFALGTNLPELSIALVAWRRHVATLSLGNVIGSAAANPFILGILAMLRPIDVLLDAAFLWVGIALVPTTLFFLYAVDSGRTLSSREGRVLLALYGIFAVGMAFLLQAR